MRGFARVNRDEIAHLYDAQPFRARTADPELLAFAEQRAAAGLAILDIGCGTGNQLIANRVALPHPWYVGLDRSFGMLRQARRKAPHIAWVRADGAGLPFPGRSFDFVCCQFAFHHINDKTGMLHAVFRVLRPGGRFVMRNLCPQESGNWLCYRYFPEAQHADLRDFWPPDAILEKMDAAGFVSIATAYEHRRFEQDLKAWLERARRRDTCSQLHAISDGAYAAGIRHLEADIADPALPGRRQDRLCLVTISAAAPGAFPARPM
jgi:ubiquinone/menaquinone biosynthesis C-methylase UbiE